jgi:hypothetical protein
MKNFHGEFTCRLHDHDYSYLLTYSSGNPKVVALGGKVKTVAKDYLKVIDASVKTAGRGFAFADDAVGLCEYLTRHHDTDVSSYIEGMRRDAKNAHSDARDIVERFSTIRKELIQACI